MDLNDVEYTHMEGITLEDLSGHPLVIESDVLLNEEDLYVKTRFRKVYKEYQKYMAMFANIGMISPKYLKATYFVMKRLFTMFGDYSSYNYEGCGRLKKGRKVTFKGNRWKKRELPTDPEIVATFFTAVLD